MHWRIGELSRQTGVSQRLLRYCEERGLLDADRSTSGQRLYVPEAVERVALVRRLLTAGLTTERIRNILPCLHAKPHERTEHLLGALRAEQSNLTSEREAIEAAAFVLEQLIDEVTKDALGTTPKTKNGERNLALRFLKLSQPGTERC